VGRLDDGRVLFVHRTAPGDLARVRLIEQKPRWVRGRLETVLEPGPGRVTPPCPRYDRCGGCTLQHVSEPIREGALRERILDAFRRIGKLPEPFPELEFHRASSPIHYRNRATFSLRRLGFQGGASRVVSGFHALESPGNIVEVGGECLLLEPALSELWTALRASWGANASRLPAGEALRLTVRTLTDGTGVLLVEGGGGRGDPEALLAEIPALRAIWHRAEGRTPSKGPRCLAGDPAPSEHWFGDEIAIQPGAFLQVNRNGAKALHDCVLAELEAPLLDDGASTAAGPTGIDLLDAYCGFGVYGRAWARRGFQSVGIELDGGAAAMGETHPVSGFTLLSGSVEDRIHEALPARQVILNPPRGGADPQVMEVLQTASGIGRIVYVSCDPATLARDLARLGPAYTLKRLQALDLFPQTAHVETIVTLEPSRRG